MTSASGTNVGGRDKTREFSFSDEDFNSLRGLVREVTGITLADSKRELVYGRLSRRLRVLAGSACMRRDATACDYTIGWRFASNPFASNRSRVKSRLTHRLHR